MPVGEDTEELARRARLIYRARRRRTLFLPDLSRHFGEPAWDMLLDLFIARATGRRVSVSSALIAADVAGSTALRRLMHLEQNGYLVRIPDDRDARRTFVEIADEAFAALAGWLAEYGPRS